MSQNYTQKKLTIYYDSACHLCHREIEMYKEKDTQSKIAYVDISEPNFNAKAEGLDSNLVKKYFHAKKSSGEIITGVEAFNEIWKTLEIFSPLQKIYKIKPFKCVMNIGYSVFAEIRPHLPQRKNCQACAVR